MEEDTGDPSVKDEEKQMPMHSQEREQEVRHYIVTGPTHIWGLKAPNPDSFSCVGSYTSGRYSFTCLSCPLPLCPHFIVLRRNRLRAAPPSPHCCSCLLGHAICPSAHPCLASTDKCPPKLQALCPPYIQAQVWARLECPRSRAL